LIHTPFVPRLVADFWLVCVCVFCFVCLFVCVCVCVCVCVKVKRMRSFIRREWCKRPCNRVNEITF